MKAVCKLSKTELARFIVDLSLDGGQCEFICRKCARMADTKGRLCKPASIAKIAAECVAEKTKKSQSKPR